ncbi:TetR family transcriptional regulator [Megasphaera cerevisiae DSM 20462]|uniref:TetR family transcriptional regulator n=1 Tax=Megasphaera cerevisiae DSM 20462 TaxID=1122219 RepID=A0A0J6WTS2_9FIRM|nr:TetR/AcrR family transcriptional regulator [Megasphaera cerevisiae]KMO85553.1 TetR family transcriptional regulator [Megasphaera cerevisiae DSM 20462]SKA17395.1 transcriptional regulator, TetR family [Megasphaera cerevisiae DSM 20462]
MKTTSRERIIQTASDLFQTKGYHATGLNEIIKNSDSPKGSLYYYFPHGKEELGVAAVRFAGNFIRQKIKNGLQRHTDPILAIQEVIRGIKVALDKERKLNNTSLSLVALETYLSSELLRTACSQSFYEIEKIYAEKLIASGFTEEKAAELGITIQTMVEGSILLSVTHGNTSPLTIVSKEIEFLISQYDIHVLK